MGKIFDLDNVFFRFMEKAVDIIILNFLWTIFSLPIITIGASTTALYYVVEKLAKNEEGYLVKEFWYGFKNNLKKATIMWSIMLIVIGVILSDIYFFSRINSKLGIIGSGIFTLILIIFLLIALYIFPLVAKYENNIKSTFINAFILAFGNLFTSISLLMIIGFLLYGFYVSVSFMTILIISGVGIYGYLSSRIVSIILEKLSVNSNGNN